MVLYRPKRGEGMGRAAAAEVIRGWGGMVPGSGEHTLHETDSVGPSARRPTSKIRERSLLSVSKIGENSDIPVRCFRFFLARR